MIILSNFSERLAELMFDAGLNAPALAKILGCGSNSITRYLAKSNLPSVKSAVAMADYFGCSVDYLLGKSDDDSAKNFNVCPKFSQRLPELLKEFHSNKYKLEKGAKIPQSAIYNWQNGKTAPDLESIEKIAEFFKCSIDCVLGREK